jgi:hypothetical protein
MRSLCLCRMTEARLPARALRSLEDAASDAGACAHRSILHRDIEKDRTGLS